MSSQPYQSFKGQLDRDFNIASMKKYVTKKTEIDKRLEQAMAPFLYAGQPRVLDACCGIGHLTRLLAPSYPDASFLGVDQTPYLIEEAKSLCGGLMNVSFETGNVEDLPTRFPSYFDVVISRQTLSWIPSYEPMLRTLMLVTRGSIFLTSLFYEGDIDFEIKIREYQKEAGRDGFNAFYNIYSLPRFRSIAASLGIGRIEVQDFDIGIDLPRGPIDVMGTYTITLADGKRMQMSGAIPMSWKIIRLDIGRI